MDLCETSYTEWIALKHENSHGHKNQDLRKTKLFRNRPSSFAPGVTELRE
jgi:hypothetical protein